MKITSYGLWFHLNLKIYVRTVTDNIPGAGHHRAFAVVAVGIMAGKERAVAYRMADEEGMCLFMEGVVAVSRHLLGAM